MKYEIEVLNKISNSRKKIAVLGDMFELGAEGKNLHRKLAPVIKQNKIDRIFLLGSLMNNLQIELKRSSIVSKHFFSRKYLQKSLLNQDYENSVILVKGSRGMKMEEFAKIIEDKISG
jgi:UDP-N-acetylmuramoyl-tripeptide--D-alanyl-D-alanine ligase